MAASADARPTPSTSAPGWPTSTPPASPAWPVTPPAPDGSHPPGPHARPPAAHRSPSRPASEPGLVVAPGDTLWSIAADHLPPGRRTPARVAAAWPRWYAANRAVIGPDPDHIEARQVLHLPTSRNRQAGS
jgi:nucleoid-associated protein YgaU